MDRDEFMELIYETFADAPDNVLANRIIEAADAYVEHEKTEKTEKTEKSVVEETKKEQAAALLRLAEVMANRFLAKPFSEVVETVRKPETMAEALKAGLEATGLLLDDADSMGTLRMNVELDMYTAPRNLDEELDRLAEKYGAEYLAEHLLDHPSNLAEIQMTKAEAEYERIIADRHGVEAVAEPEPEPEHEYECITAVPIDDLDTGELMLELDIADAITYVEELMDLRNELVGLRKDLHKALAVYEDDLK